MHSARGRSSWWAASASAVLGLAAGCGTHRAHVEQALLANNPPPAHVREVAQGYHARCPDVLAVEVAGLPGAGGAQRIAPDGRITLPGAGRVRVDDETPPEIARTVAFAVGVPPEQVRVKVAEYNSQQLFLFGEVAGLQRAVPYQGPETVLDLLHRVGGISPGAALGDVRVIRPHVADGKAPEVFHIDLQAIVLKNDPQTNVVLLPHDHVYIGQSRRSNLCSCLPPWLRPLYNRVHGLR